jgi:hypothetical protein
MCAKLPKAFTQGACKVNSKKIAQEYEHQPSSASLYISKIMGWNDTK